MGLYTNLGALLMGSDHIDDCLAALKQALALALEYRQTDSYLVCLLSAIFLIASKCEVCPTQNTNTHCLLCSKALV